MADEMHERVARHEISLVRGNARRLVRAGQAFKFTAAEVADLERRKALMPVVVPPVAPMGSGHMVEEHPADERAGDPEESPA